MTRAEEAAWTGEDLGGGGSEITYDGRIYSPEWPGSRKIIKQDVHYLAMVKSKGTWPAVWKFIV